MLVFTIGIGALNPLRVPLQRGLVALVATAALCTGCGDVQVSRSSDSDEPGTPIRGGTLKVVGSSDVDHLATVSGYVTGSLWLTRTFARQLVTYPPATDFVRAFKYFCNPVTPVGAPGYFNRWPSVEPLPLVRPTTAEQSSRERSRP